MQTKSRCHHRYIAIDDTFFVTEDGMKGLNAVEKSQGFPVCGHVDSPIDMKEVPQKEKRTFRHTTQQQFFNVIDLF